MTGIIVRTDASPVQRQRATSPTTVSPDFWNQPELASPLAKRDVATVYRVLQQAGLSQRAIAALTGQQQSEICEILAGRQVRMIQVLERIADGLGIPRRRMGLADADYHERRTNEDRRLAVAGASPDLDETRRPTRARPLPATAARTPGRPVTKTVFRWTGAEVHMLRAALRMSVREFAAHLGVSDRMVSKWEAGGVDITPRPVNQAALDTCLARSSAEAQARFAGWPTRKHDHASLLESDRWVVHVAVDVRNLEEAVRLAEHFVTSAPVVEISVHDTTVSPESLQTHRYRVFCDRMVDRARRCRKRHGHLGECDVAVHSAR